tara:strand:- start:647 stop:784 length:138 start_codon:yes stop_codon:yes gene_type:complete
LRKNQHVIDFLKFGNYNTVMLYAVNNEKEFKKLLAYYNFEKEDQN